MDQFRYYVDLFMSSNPAARFLGLGVVSLLTVAFCAVLALMVSPPDGELSGNFLEAMWWALIRVVDSGGMAEDKDLPLRIVAIVATACGIMVVALLIGLVGTAMSEKLEALREGRSPVIDSDHTLILGYGEKIFPILRELAIANQNRSSSTIVILSEHAKTTVEDAVRERAGDLGKTRVVVRHGSPFGVNHLKKVGAGRARSIIVLADAIAAGDGEEGAAAGQDPDMAAIKTILALRRVPGALRRNHAVVELQDSRRASVIEKLGGGGVEVVAMRETLARLMVQTARQTGLAGVYRTLLGFDGAEFYLKRYEELTGKTFADAQAHLQGAIAVGVRRVGADGQTALAINPPQDMKIGDKDEVIVLAEDDDTFSLDVGRKAQVTVVEPPAVLARPRRPERVLICGIRADIRMILNDFDAYAAAGSEMVWMPGPDGMNDELWSLTLKNMKIEVDAGDPTDPEAVARIIAGGFDSVLLVANDLLAPDEADARTVITLLMLRDGFAAQKSGRQPRIISEILDTRTKDLVNADESTDFVVSSEVTSMLLAQISEQRDVNALWTDLFSPDGSEIYLKSVERYAPAGTAVTWGSVLKVAARYGEIAIGCYRHGAPPLINPAVERPLQFSPGDKIIVLAEDDLEGGVDQKAAA